MVELISKKVVTAKKTHECGFCGLAINPGEKYLKSFCKYEGDVYDWNAHPQCNDIVGKIWEYADVDEGMSEDLFQESVQALYQEFLEVEEPEYPANFRTMLEAVSLFFEVYELKRIKNPNRPWERKFKPVRRQ